ncbi:hypothetical protein K523DRAFT_302678 [Schizophyllum commune Tattone D]|nr:hypothetical protein K523DRAFT_302678 [Schizophyllum commune Tattone D]
MMPSTSYTTAVKRTRAERRGTRQSTAATLPTELLTEIFCLHLGIVGGRWSGRPWEDRQSPLPLTHVCSSWRQIVMDKPEFWTHLVISCPTSVSYELRLRQYADWIERSSPHPISVKLPVRYTIRDKANMLASTLLPRCASRISTLDLDMAGHNYQCDKSITALLTLAPGIFPALMHLKLGYKDNLPDNKVITVFNQSPLRSLSFNVEARLEGILGAEALLDVAWKELEDLSLDFEDPSIGTAESLSWFIFRHLRDVQSLSLAVVPNERPGAMILTLPHRATLPRMRKLTMTTKTCLLPNFSHTTTDQALFRTLDLPALEELHVCYEYDHRFLTRVEEGFLPHKFPSGLFDDEGFRQTSLGQLRELHLTGFGRVPGEKLLPLLEATLMLEKLVLSDSMELRRPFYERMASPSVLVPLLQTLEFRYTDGETREDFVAMTEGIEVLLRGRWGGRVRGLQGSGDPVLKEMIVTRDWEGKPVPAPRKFDKAWMDAMKKLRPAGAKLSLK